MFSDKFCTHRRIIILIIFYEANNSTFTGEIYYIQKVWSKIYFCLSTVYQVVVLISISVRILYNEIVKN
jgi:hypothetical protein